MSKSYTISLLSAETIRKIPQANPRLTTEVLISQECYVDELKKFIHDTTTASLLLFPEIQEYLLRAEKCFDGLEKKVCDHFFYNTTRKVTTIRSMIHYNTDRTLICWHFFIFDSFDGENMKWTRLHSIGIER